MTINFDKNISENSIPENDVEKLLINDLDDVTNKINDVSNKINKQNELYQKIIVDISLTDQMNLQDEKTKSIVKEMWQIEQEIQTLKEEEKELKELQSELNERIAHFQPTAKQSTPLRKTLLKIIYPASDFYSLARLTKEKLHWAQKLVVNDEVFSHEAGVTYRVSFESEVQKLQAKRISFYTEDNCKLEGCIVFANPKDHQLKHKKMMIMALGNLYTWQQAYDHAKLMATKFDCNVLLYNPRGVGKSTGKTQFLQDAVADCKAAISYALKKACQKDDQIDSQRLAVYGHSLGGGVSAIALQELIQKGKISDKGIGLYINHHSFSSLSGFVKGISVVGPMLKSLSRKIIKMSHHNLLEAKKAIMETRLAQHVIVATGAKDDMMGKLARLNHALLHATGKKKPIANDVMYITIPDYGHHEETEYLLDYEELQKKNIVEDDSGDHQIEAEKLVQLQKYHNAIAQWAKN